MTTPSKLEQLTKNEIEILDDIFNHSEILLKTIETYEK